MSIKSIEAEELREMTGKEGLILQGCGGPLQEWLDGINDMLTEAGILQNGSRFTDIYAFEHEGLTNLLFPSSTSASWQCGGCRPSANSAANG